jgi:hypothetical protein
MPNRRSPRSSSAAGKLAELSLAAPQVVAHRLTRMALAGPVLSSRDRKEFTGMVHEKQLAFSQGLMGAWLEVARVNQAMLLSAMTSLWTPKSPLARARTSARQMNSGMNTVADKFLAPVHRKAVSNARRLAKTRLR